VRNNDYHRAHELAEKLWIIADEAPRKKLTAEQRTVIRLFGMILDQCALAFNEFERYYFDDGGKKREGFRLMRHTIKQHWPKRWHSLMEEHLQIARDRMPKK